MEEKSVPYPFAYDEDETERCKLMNEILKHKVIFGSNLWPIVTSGKAEGIDDVLDLGCGSAVWAQEVANANPATQITGFDIHEPSIGPSSSGNFTFIRGDISEELPFPDESFDLVQIRICPNIRQRAELYQEVHRILNEDGVIQLLEPYNFIPPDSTESDENNVFSRMEDVFCKIFTPSQTYVRNRWSLDPIDAVSIQNARGSSRPRWTQVKQFYIVLPVGEWSSNPVERELGALMSSYLTLFWRGLHGEIIQKSFMSEDEYLAVERDLEAAIKTKLEIKMMYNCLCAKKRVDM